MDLSVVWPSEDRCGRVPEHVSHFFKMIKNEKNGSYRNNYEPSFECWEQSKE